MAQLQRVEGQTELKCHADKFFDVCGRKPYLVSEFCPTKYPKIELHEGEWHKAGAVIVWNYCFKDIAQQASVKSRVEELDEEKRLIRYSYHDGDLVKIYKTIQSMVQVTPKGEGCTVKWRIEYEKKNEDTPEPNVFIDAVLGVAKDIDACLCSA